MRQYFQWRVLVGYVVVMATIGTLAILAGCKPAGTTVQGGDEQVAANVSYTILVRGRIARLVDSRAGVVCYTYAAADGGGISCLPLSQTELGQ